jgi:hypothetical protein
VTQIKSSGAVISRAFFIASETLSATKTFSAGKFCGTNRAVSPAVLNVDFLGRVRIRFSASGIRSKQSSTNLYRASRRKRA